MTGNKKNSSSFSHKLSVQRRVVWALILRETITRYGRENIGILWFFVEPLLFTIGITILWSFSEGKRISTGSVAELAIVSYPTILLWRNSTGRVSKAIEVNKPLLHNRPIRHMDFFYSRIILEFASVSASFLLIFLSFIVLGISHAPADLLAMVMGWVLIAWFSFGFVIIMGALSELSDSIERTSHIILYFMLPFSGILPTYLVPEPFRSYLLLFPLVNCVEYFRYGYYGESMATYFNLKYTIMANLFFTLFALTLMNKAIRKTEIV